MISAAGLLIGAGNAVEIGDESDDGFGAGGPLRPSGDPGGGDTGDAAFDFEAVLFEDGGEVFRGFDFLETAFAVYYTYSKCVSPSVNRADLKTRISTRAESGAGYSTGC